MRVLTAKKLKHWLWCITQTATVEMLPDEPPQREPWSFKARDEAAEAAARKEKRRAK